MQQRVSLITLGARDPEHLARFYDAVGWQRVDSPDGVIAFDLLGQTLGIYPLEKLAEDMGLALDEIGHGAMTLGHNVREKNDVAPLMEKAKKAGARILRPATDIFWGGHVGYFADPEGQIWEIAWNPHSPLSGDGAFRWNGY